MYNVYVLSSDNSRKSYVGCSGNIERRLSEHNAGKMAFTKRYMPWKLIYYEEYKTLIEARKREKFFKTGTGRRFLKKLFD